MSLAPGTRLGPYEILASLGAGGMGEVYRAHDTKLGRDIALKVLPASVTADPVRLERFDREARAIAALNHPHIVTIFSTEEAGGVRFFTMELVDGQALDALIPPEGLPLPRFLELALPIADALTAAHQKQITHRDLKPGNVMVSRDGRVKVLDFGLARVAEPEDEAALDATRALLTHEGTIVGTMPYMSPEQVEGRTLDHRSDLFSLGVVMYEMLAGARPFQGGSSAQLMSAILRDTPPGLGERRGDVPDTLVRLVSRCLEKRPEDRVQTARDIYNELRHVQKQLESGSRPDSRRTEAAEAPLWIAVLPFASRSADSDAEALASGLTEDITSGLSRFPALSVVAPQSARAFKDNSLDARLVAERLGARYVLGGTVRKSASTLRVAVHLADTRSGAQMWTETYDQALAEADLFAIQDDVTDRIVATVADKAGVLARSMVQAVRQLSLSELSARELILRCWSYQWHPVATEHADMRAALEHHLSRHPDNPHLWAELANMYVCEHSLFFNPLPNALERAMRAARRAIEIDPGNQEGWGMVALEMFYRKDESGMLEASDRAIRLNPRNSNALAWMGNIRTHAGDYDRGCELTTRAMTLNPAHPGWYHFAPFNRHFVRGEYTDALKAARRVNMPEFMWMPFAIAAAAGHLGLVAEGRAATESMLALAPPFADEANLREFVSRWYWDPDVIESLLDGVRKAREQSSTGTVPRGTGADAAAASRPAARPGSEAGSGTTVVGTWIAVLPFTLVTGAGGETEMLADGLTEDITAGLSKFSYLSVVAAQSARQVKRSHADVRQIGEVLRARYLLEGSIRRAGDTLRIATRLIDARTGAQLWSETYNRDIGATNLLAVQDEVTDRVVATVADVHGVLFRSMSQDLADRSIDELSAAELLRRYWTYNRQHSRAEHQLLRGAYEELVRRSPNMAAAWSALANLYCHEHAFGFNAQLDSLRRAHRAVDRALALDALDQHGWEVLATTYFFARDRDGFVHAAERAIALNPRNANTSAWIGSLYSHVGDFDRGAALTERAMALNPDHPGWYYFAFFIRDYYRRRFAEALQSAKRINMPQHLWSHFTVAIAAGQLGRQAEATAAVEAFYAVAPEMADQHVLLEAAHRWDWVQDGIDLQLDGFHKALALRAALTESTPHRPRSGADPTSTSSSSSRDGVDAQPAAADLRVAVLPFTTRGGDEAAAALADGLTDDITTGLSRFEHLRVLSRAAAEPSGGRAGSPAPPGVRYVLEGTVRTAASAVRVGVRLSDTHTSANVWAENFDLDSGSGIFTLQDEVANRVVATVGDPTGVLAKAMRTTLADVPLEQLGIEGLVVRYHAYAEQFRPEEHARLREALERLVARDTGSAEGWALLSLLYEHEHSHGLNPRPDALGRQRRAAERALELDSRCQQAWVAQASVNLFARDVPGLRGTVERAVSINPLNADQVALCALFLSVATDDERAVELARSAIRHKPQHPGWYHFPTFNWFYIKGQDEAALAEARLINMPLVPFTHMSAAAAAGQLGRVVDASLALESLRTLDPAMLDLERARQLWSMWVGSGALLDRLVEGFRKALALATLQKPAAPPG